MYFETPLRSVLKAVSWRFFGTFATFAVVLMYMKRLDLALAVGGVEAIGKIAFFFVHERVWDKIHIGKRLIQPSVIWLTGLPSAGKTTLALALIEELKKRKLRAEHLDGDSIRAIFPNTGFSRKEREDHIQRVGFLASRLEANGLFVVVSLISPWESSRSFVRGLCKNFGEVHVSTPLAVCEKRDVKGLYRKARAGEMRHFTGVNDPYEIPMNPELRIDTSHISVDQACEKIIEKLRL